MEFRLTDPSSLKAIRLAQGESHRVFGLTLKRAAGDLQATIGYSGAYIVQLENGNRKCTAALEAAYRRIAAALDDADPVTSTARPASVYATHDISGALVLGEARQCARPGCKVRFVPTNYFQRYHSTYCRKQNAASHKKEPHGPR